MGAIVQEASGIGQREQKRTVETEIKRAMNPQIDKIVPYSSSKDGSVVRKETTTESFNQGPVLLS